MHRYSNEHGSVIYLNSGDWIENLTALEYSSGEWTIFQYKEEDFIDFDIKYPDLPDSVELSIDESTLNKVLFQS